MEKGTASRVFVNDGSFMERFKQLQQEKGKGDKVEESRLNPTLSGPGKPNPVISSNGSVSRASDSRKINQAPSSGKLAFSLKQKSKLVAPAVKLSEDEDEDEKNAGKASGDGPIKRQKLDQPDQSLKQVVGNFRIIPPKWCEGDKTFLNYFCVMNAANTYLSTSVERDVQGQIWNSVAACYKNNLDSFVHALDLIGS